MMMSMYSAVSGLKSQQTKLNVIGNNISNISTVGYKSQKVGFSDLLSQNISSASGASGNMGGTNAKQIGLGTQVSSIEMTMSPGSSQYTGNDTDVALGGEGFFIVQGSTPDDRKYTRAGNFGVDTKGNLVLNGMKACGYEPGTKGPLTALNIFDVTPGDGKKYNLAQQITSKASLMGNLDSSKSTVASPTAVTSTMTVYDSLGVSHEVALTFTNTPATQSWTVTGTVDGGLPAAVTITGSPVTFDANGKMLTPATKELGLSITIAGGATTPQTVKVGMSGITGAASATGTSSVRVADIDGYASGTLKDFSIGADGVITGSYSNGQKKSVGQLVVATFNNSAGLEKIGDNLYDRTMNSGEPAPEIPGSGQAAKLTTGALEMSNVDLANEFSEMMITQRAYQANSKIITTSDTLMETLINMSR